MPTLPTASELPPSVLYEYTGHKLIAVAIAFIPLEIIFVGARYYARSMHKTTLGVDDILVAPALLMCITLDILGIGQSTTLLRVHVTTFAQCPN